MQRRESTKKNKLEIEVEVSHGKFETRYIPMEAKFTMATDVAFDVLLDLGRSAFAIYLVILKHRNLTTNKCFPSYTTIKKESGCGLSNIKETLNKLEEAGYLIINSGMRGIANNYYFPQEWFYAYFEDDINQRLAKRKDKIQVITEQRETKVEKENKALSKENEELKRQLMKANEQIEKIMKRKEQEDDEVLPVRKAQCYKEEDDLDEDWF